MPLSELTGKQQRLMRAVAHGWKPPASSGISVPRSVAEEYVHPRGKLARMQKDMKRR